MWNTRFTIHKFLPTIFLIYGFLLLIITTVDAHPGGGGGGGGGGPASIIGDLARDGAGMARDGAKGGAEGGKGGLKGAKGFGGAMPMPDLVGDPDAYPEAQKQMSQRMNKKRGRQNEE